MLASDILDIRDGRYITKDGGPGSGQKGHTTPEENPQAFYGQLFSTKKIQSGEIGVFMKGRDYPISRWTSQREAEKDMGSRVEQMVRKYKESHAKDGALGSKQKEINLDQEKFKEMLNSGEIVPATIHETMGPNFRDIYWSPARRPFVKKEDRGK